MTAQNLSYAWIHTLVGILDGGSVISPRGKMTKELSQHTMQVDMRKPVLIMPARGLSYKFMAAEAYWILSGDDLVENIAPYNKNIAAFSDDGHRFFGAYGPKVVDQLPYVVKKLLADQNSRQAGLTIWRESPPPETKDVPCTVAIFFGIRDQRLNVHVFMRSSDAWLGVPYDAFNFSMLGHLVCGLLNQADIGYTLEPGTLYLTAASSHLYQINWAAAEDCVLKYQYEDQKDTPDKLYRDPEVLLEHLHRLRDEPPGSALRWWLAPS